MLLLVSHVYPDTISMGDISCRGLGGAENKSKQRQLACLRQRCQGAEILKLLDMRF